MISNGGVLHLSTSLHMVKTFMGCELWQLEGENQVSSTNHVWPWWKNRKVAPGTIYGAFVCLCWIDNTWTPSEEVLKLLDGWPSCLMSRKLVAFCMYNHCIVQNLPSPVAIVYRQYNVCTRNLEEQNFRGWLHMSNTLGSYGMTNNPQIMCNM